MSMATWKSKIIKKQGKASRNAGKAKYGKKYPTPLQKWMAKHNRSWKHKDYWRWLQQKDGVSA